MKKMFVCLSEDFSSIELSKKGWNYVATLFVILAGWYWLGLCDNGALFQLTGCALFIFAAGVWAAKTDWAKKFWEVIDEGRKYSENEYNKVIK
jgi:drug/metabolite transporter (DMT)-like permease